MVQNLFLSLKKWRLLVKIEFEVEYDRYGVGTVVIKNLRGNPTGEEIAAAYEKYMAKIKNLAESRREALAEFDKAYVLNEKKRGPEARVHPENLETLIAQLKQRETK